MDISFSQQEGFKYFSDQNFAKIPLMNTRIQINNYTHDPKPPQPMGSTSNIRSTTTEHPHPATGVGGGGIILVPNLRFALDSFVVKTQHYIACNEASLLLQCIITEKQSNQINTTMKQRKGLMNHRSLVRAKGNLKLSYIGSSQVRHLTNSAPSKIRP